MKNHKSISVKNESHSSLSEFVKKPLATKEEVQSFEDTIRDKYRQEEIEENLSEIYQDKEGNMIDVSKLKARRKPSFGRSLLKWLLILVVLGALAYGAWWYFVQGNTASGLVDLEISGPSNVAAGEEFFLTVSYNNPSETDMTNVELEMVYPDNFVFLDSSVAPIRNNSVWELANLAKLSAGTITIKGKIINKAGVPNNFNAKISYIPSNFSSQFKADSSLTIVVKNIGFDIRADYLETALIGETQDVSLIFQAQDQNFINSFDLMFDVDDNIELSLPEEEKVASSSLIIVAQERNTWHVSGLTQTDSGQELKFSYRVKEKTTDQQTIKLEFSQLVNSERLVFLDMPLDLEIMKSDLNLTLTVNNSKQGSPVSFGDILNYSLDYNNKGEVAMKDVTIMAVINSSLVDWSHLVDATGGVQDGGSIVWTKEQMPALAEIKPNAEGNINFSVPIKAFEEDNLGQNLEVSAYAQFSLGNSEDFADDLDNRSNMVSNELNSNLNLDEQIRYFTDDNIPVGSGPLPPQVGETTQFRGTWLLTNDLHDLENVSVSVVLPNYITWGGQVQVTQGNLNYNAASHTLTWKLGNLPVTIYEAYAEFNLTMTPNEDDANKILVISPGAEAIAADVQTRVQINSKSSATTTKLEEDEIANLSSNGIVKP